MNTTQIIFSIFFNSIFSFLAGIMIVVMVLKLFRIDNSRWKLLILCLPFIKILWDLFKGTAQTSFWQNDINPFSLPVKHHYFTAGLGFCEFGPILNVVFSLKDINGNQYSVSVADYLGFFISKYYGTSILLFATLFFFSISLILLFNRFWKYYSFEKQRKIDFKNGKIRLLEQRKIKSRIVELYVSSKYRGTPFTGGIFKPFICIPEETFIELSSDELDAVIKHELIHVRYFDLPITLSIKILGDIFWFVPGYRFLSRKIDRLREILADKGAVNDGATPSQLSLVLIKLKEIQIDLRHNVLYSAFFREKSLIKERVLELTNNYSIKASRFGWKNIYVRIFVTIWTFGGVMIATLGGNYEYEKTPEWIEEISKYFGFL